jgi:autotransporter-associated beta strand protein
VLPSTRSLLTRSLLLVLLAPSVLAATRTWTGANGVSWSDAGNWGGTAPVAGDALVFPSGASNLTNTNNLPAGTLIQSIVIEDEYQLNGNGIVIGAGGITANTLGTPGISIPLQLGAAQTWTNIHAPFPELILSGAVELSGFALTLGGSSYGRITGTISGSGSITKSGASSWALSGNNDYVGPTVINSGGLAALNANAFGLADNTLANGTIVNDGGTIGLGLPSLTALAPEYLQFHGLSTLNTGASATVSGIVELADGITTIYAEYATMTFDGVITGAAQFKVTGSDATVVVANPANDFSGPVVMVSPIVLRVGANEAIPPGKSITINGVLELDGKTLSLASLAGPGFLKLGTGGSLTVSGPGTTTFSGSVLDSGTVRLTGGDLTLIGNNTFTGVALNDGGILRILAGSLAAPFTQSTGTFGLANNASVNAVTIQGGTFAPGLSGTGIGNSGNLSLGSGATYLEPINGSASGAFGRLRVSGTVDLGGSSLVLSGSATGVAGGTQFSIIDNDGFDAISSTFAGLSEGATIAGGPGNFNYVITYAGGTGNDVVLTAMAPTSVTLASSLNPSNSGQSVTFTATVSPQSGVLTPTGTVTFLDGVVTLATVPLTSGTATFTTSSLTTGTHVITATYNGDATFAAATSAALEQEVLVLVPTLDARFLIAFVLLLSGIAIVALRQ